MTHSPLMEDIAKKIIAACYPKSEWHPNNPTKQQRLRQEALLRLSFDIYKHIMEEHLQVSAYKIQMDIKMEDRINYMPQTVIHSASSYQGYTTDE